MQQRARVMPDVGMDRYTTDGKVAQNPMNLPAYKCESSSMLPSCKQEVWSEWERYHQTNNGQPNIDGLSQNGQFWPHTWTPVGPIDPFTPRTQVVGGQVGGQVVPGPTDPQTAYGIAITAALDGQDEKFTVQENPNSVTYKYLHQLQQLPGSHYQVTAASFDGFDTAQVVDRFAHLPQVAAKWVVYQLNMKMHESHPCFSLAGREHFELSNPPLQCGDISTIKKYPITLIRVFEARVQKRQDGGQEIYLTMEIGNMISAGSGGMYQVRVTMDKFQNLIAYTPLARDQKHTFVLPRTRT